jgi:hypothetical protein
MMALKSSEWWSQVMPQLGASLTIINYSYRVANYAPKEHLYSTSVTHDDQNMFRD